MECRPCFGVRRQRAAATLSSSPQDAMGGERRRRFVSQQNLGMSLPAWLPLIQSGVALLSCRYSKRPLRNRALGFAS